MKVQKYYACVQYNIYNEGIKSSLTVAVRALRALSIRQPSTRDTAAGQSGRESINLITMAIERGQTRFCENQLEELIEIQCVYRV